MHMTKHIVTEGRQQLGHVPPHVSANLVIHTIKQETLFVGVSISQSK